MLKVSNKSVHLLQNYKTSKVLPTDLFINSQVYIKDLI